MGVQMIDGNVLINAFRAGRDDRYQADQRKAAAEKARQAEAQDVEYKGLMGQYLGVQRGGVTGQFASPNPQANVSPFDAAQGTIGQGETPPIETPQAPVQAPQVDRQALLGRMMTLKPEETQKLITGLKTLSDTEIAQRTEQNTYTGSVALWLSRQPEAERAASFQAIVPDLRGHGLNDQQISMMAQMLHGPGLDFFMKRAHDVDTALDNERADRTELRQNNEMLAGKTVPVTAGGNVAIIKPIIGADGNVTGTSKEWAIGGGGNATGANPPPDAIAELRANPATAAQFDEIFGPGAAQRALGGGVSNGTGGFPAGQ